MHHTGQGPASELLTVPVDTTTTIITSYGYDPAGNMTRFTDGRNNTTIYRYQEWGLQAEVEEPATAAHPNLSDRLWGTVYDPGGLAVEERQPGGVTVTRSFDQLGRLTQESGSGTDVVTATRSLGYDLAGRLTTASHPDGTLGFGWDDRGLLVEVTGPAGSATYTYDEAGRMTERVDAAGTATFAWTPRSELETVEDPVTGTVITYDWDAASQLESVTYGTGQAPFAPWYSTTWANWSPTPSPTPPRLPWPRSPTATTTTATWSPSTSTWAATPTTGFTATATTTSPALQSGVAPVRWTCSVLIPRR